jgi:hypothetical protein
LFFLRRDIRRVVAEPELGYATAQLMMNEKSGSWREKVGEAGQHQ